MSTQPGSGLGVKGGNIIHNTTWSGECFPHLRAQLVGLHFGLFLESVVGVVVSEGILDEGCEHEHVANPEVNVQGLDG